jgi:hypothetical protein
MLRVTTSWRTKTGILLTDQEFARQISAISTSFEASGYAPDSADLKYAFQQVPASADSCQSNALRLFRARTNRGKAGDRRDITNRRFGG